jgi:hypothetical protein
MFSSNTETGVTVTYQDSDNTIDVEIDAAQTTITSLLATDIKIGEDDQTKIDFETADEIHFYAANVEQVYLADNIFGPQTDSDVDLGTTGVRWKDAYIDSVTVTDNVTVGGNLTVNGTTTTVNSTTVTIDDPIFTLGGDTAPGSDDNKDRGIEFRWHNGSAAKVGFFGYDDSAGAFTFIPDATNSSEVFSGTVGNVAFGDIAGTLTTAAQTNITSVGALDGGSITSGFGAIDNGTSGIRTNTFTAETSILPDAVGGADLGSTSAEWGDVYIADDKKIYFGNDQDVSMEYDEDGIDTLLVSGDVTFADDKKLYFGTGKDVSIEYDEDGIDTLLIAGGDVTIADDKKLYFGSGKDVSLEYDEDGNDTLSVNGDLLVEDDKKLYLGSNKDFSIEYDEDGNDTTAVVAANGVSFAPHGTSTGNTTELRFQELAANGANYVGFKGPDAVSTNEVWTLPNADGSAGEFLKTDGSNTLSWGAAGASITATADGAITDGKPVVLTSTGKVAQVSGNREVVGGLSGADTGMSTRGQQSEFKFIFGYCSSVDRFITTYQYSTTVNGARTRVIQVDGLSITKGSEISNLYGSDTQSPNSDGTTQYVDISGTHAGKMVAFFNAGESSTESEAAVVSITGGTTNTATVGTHVSWVQSSTDTNAAGGNDVQNFLDAWDDEQDQGIAIYRTGTDNYKVRGRVYTVSGTSISFGTKFSVFDPQIGTQGASTGAVIANVGAGKYICASLERPSQSSGARYLFYQPVTVSATDGSVTLGQQYSYNITGYSTGTAGYVFPVGEGLGNMARWGTETAAVLMYRNTANGANNALTSIYLTFNGSGSTATISPSTAVGTVATNETYYPSSFYMDGSDKLGVVYLDNADTGTKSVMYNEATRSGTTLTWGTPETIDDSTSTVAAQTIQGRAATSANGGEVLLTYPDSGASPTGAQAMRVKLVSSTRSTNLNAENYIGIATATVSDGASASVAIAGGTDDAQSSLTPAQAYYVQIDGTLATTPDSPRVFAGTALTSTTIAIGKTDHENDGRVFIGGYDFRRDGGSTGVSSLLVSLPGNIEANNVAAYEMEYYGIQIDNSGDYLYYRPYSGTSSVLQGTDFRSQTMWLQDNNSTTSYLGNHETNLSAGFPMMHGGGNGGIYRPSSTQQSQTATETSTSAAAGGFMTGKARYVNAIHAASGHWESAYRYGTDQNDQITDKGHASAHTVNTVTNFADGIFIYPATSTGGLQSTSKIWAGQVNVYAIIKNS